MQQKELDEAIGKIEKFAKNLVSMKNFINIADINKQDLRKIIELPNQKKKRSNINKSAIDPEKPLVDKTLIILLKSIYENKIIFRASNKAIGWTFVSLIQKTAIMEVEMKVYMILQKFYLSMVIL